MRPTKVTLSALGNSVWVPLDYIQAPFAVSLAAILSSGAVLTYSVQNSFDPVNELRPISISRAGTVATVTDVNHGLSIGDGIVISGSGDANLDTQIANVATVLTANTYTYTVANTGLTSSTSASAANMRQFPDANLFAQTARGEGNYAFPTRACRLVVSAYTSGVVELIILQGVR